MTEPAILLYFADAFSVGNSRFALAADGQLSLLDAADISGIDQPLITFEAPILVDELRRRGAELPSQIVDMGEALRLLTGLAKSDGGEARWNFWANIRSHFTREADWKRAYDLNRSRTIIHDVGDIEELFSAFASASLSLWTDILARLQASSEYSRFFDVEVPSAQTFYFRQRHGLPIRLDALARHLETANQAKYAAYRVVAEILAVSPTGLNYWNVAPYLQHTDMPKLDFAGEGMTLRGQLRMAREQSKFAAAFTKYMDETRNVEILNRMLDDGDGRVYPTFHPLGTISARILLSDPFIQELKRDYRGVVGVDPGMRSLYFDYSQFEPGIAASLSGDGNLIRLYNEGDVYAALSEYLFGDRHGRDLCKQVFLAFLYGMSAKSIATLLVKKGASVADAEAIRLKVNEFFSAFSSLSAFKVNAQKTLAEKKFVSTLNGNSRHRARGGTLTAKEQRWAVSQQVQGNASLIFKRAIISLADKFGPGSILLPMHDAVLMQFPEPQVTETLISAIQSEMVSAFHYYCPDVNVRVSAGEFSAM